MEVKRYIMTQGVLTKENQLIPIWDNRLVFEKDDNYGNSIRFKDDFRSNQLRLVECVYDLKTKEVNIGVELNYYPKKTEFQKGETVFFEKSLRNLGRSKIVDIVYETYDLEITKGRKIDKFWVSEFKDVTIEPNTLYAIKHWKPFFILENGQKIEWAHQLYHKAK